jgi:outer membrane lipoprotein-sorting protein
MEFPPGLDVATSFRNDYIITLQVVRIRRPIPVKGSIERCGAWLSQSVVLLCCVAFAWAWAEPLTTPSSVLERMRSAYAAVGEYQTDVEAKTVRSDGSLETERFLYSFRKPNHVRLDLKMPHPGSVVIYPDKNGKVVVKPFETVGFLKLRLSPDSRILRARPGHRIDQSDMGLLLENIGHSLTDQRRGPIGISEKDGIMVIQILATDHFRSNTVTLYEFRVDPRIWLPVGVKESTAEGQLERVTSFENLKLNPGLSDTFFDVDSPRGSIRTGNDN